jgi:hypothetical protein
MRRFGTTAVTWNVENVALSGTSSAPSMAETGSSVNISAVGSGDRLNFYWAENGTDNWITEQVAPPGSVR